MNRIRQHLSGHARPYAIGLGMGVFLLGVLGTLMLVAQVQLQAITTSQAALVERLEAVAQEADDLLDRLNAKYSSDCTAANLVDLRNLLFETRFLRDIGLLNPQGASSAPQVSGSGRTPTCHLRRNCTRCSYPTAARASSSSTCPPASVVKSGLPPSSGKGGSIW